MSSPSLLYKVPDPHLQRRTKLDEEIARREAQLVSLKRDRNSLLPITRLHPEVLQEIFLLVHISSADRGRASLLVTWIHHTWRDLAHNTSSLWCHMNFRNPEWIGAALSRTKNRELEFNLNSGSPVPMRSTRSMTTLHVDLSLLTSLCLDQLSRIRKLKLVSNSRHTSFSVSFPPSAPQWQIPALALVELHLQGLDLPPNLFSGTCPSLRSLCLASCSMDWETIPVTQNLICLSITYPRTKTSARKVLEILHMMRASLEDLALKDVFDPNSESSAPVAFGADRFRLEKLGSLHLEYRNTPSFEQLFHHISLPPRLKLHVVLNDWAESDVSFVNALISARNIKKWPMEYLEVKIHHESIGIRVTENWDQMDDSIDIAERDDNRTHVHLEIQHASNPSEVLSIFPLLPIQPITTVFFVGGFQCAQNPTTLEYIGGLGTVSRLCIELPFLETFTTSILAQQTNLRTLVDEDEDITGPFEDQEQTTLARNMISFHGLQDLEVYCGDDNQLSITYEEILTLRKWLEWRMWFGLGLARLVLSGLTTPPIRWMDEVIYDGLVGMFEKRYLTEIEGVDE